VMYRIVNANDIIPAFPLGSSQSTPSLALHRESDYKHVGVPVVLHYDAAEPYTIGTARGLESVVKDALWFAGVSLPAAVGRFVLGRASLVGVVQSGWPFPWEHLPSEYDRRLGKK
ncbi:hypothetical protein HDU98_011826, partial [Podochytrium sp. JEL0797]